MDTNPNIQTNNGGNNNMSELVIFKMVAGRKNSNGDLVLKSFLDETADSWEKFLAETFSPTVGEKEHIISAEQVERLQEEVINSDDYEELYNFFEDTDYDDESVIVDLIIDIAEHTRFTVEEICRKLTDFPKDEVELMSKMEEPEVYFKAHI